MADQIFKFPKGVGLVGQRRVGREYMLQIEERARMLEAASAPKPAHDDRQQRLPMLWRTRK